MKKAIWVLLVGWLLVFPNQILPGDSQIPPSFTSLFNGKDLAGWKVIGGQMAAWGAEKGILFVKGGGGGWLMTDKEYGDFELRLGYKIPPQGNSGVALRSPFQGNPAFDGMEIQLLDDPWYKANLEGLKPTQLTGSIYDVVPPSQEAIKPAGEWNEIRIVAQDRRIAIEINGIKVVDAKLDEHKDKSDKHPGLMRSKGHIGLQSHDGRVEFRDIWIKPL